MRYYSITAFSRESLQYPDPEILIEPGANVFTVLTGDVDALVQMLEGDGVRINEVNCLDGSEAFAGAGETSADFDA